MNAARAMGAGAAPAFADGADGDDGALSRFEGTVFVLVSLANLVPIFCFRYFAGQDTANHLYVADVLRALLDGSAPAPVSRFFAVTLGLKSNIVFPLLVVGLARVGVPIIVSHRLILAFYALSFPLAGLFCARAAAPSSRVLALLLLPLVWNWFALQGLYNFVLSLIPGLVWLGLVARHGGRPPGSALAALTLASLAVYFAHTTTFVALLLITVVRIAGGPRPAGASRFASLAAARPLGWALAPALALAGISVWAGWRIAHAPLEPTVSGWEEYGVLSAAGTFFVEFAIRHHAWELAILGPPLVALIAIPIGAGLRGLRAGARTPIAAATPWALWAAAILVVLYFALPHIAIGSDVSPRLRPWIVLCLLCHGGVLLSRRARRAVAIMALATGLASVLALSVSFARLAPELDAFTSGIPYVREGARLYPMVFEPRAPSILVKPFLHAWGYYGLARKVITPYAFAWSEDRFPVRYRRLPAHEAASGLPSDAEDQPYALMQGRLCASVRRYAPSQSCAEIREEAEERLATLGESYDYVLTWAAPGDFVERLRRRGYRSVHEQGLLALYQPATTRLVR